MKSTAKVIELRREEETVEVPNEVAQSPLYGVAMLKIAMELKKADAPSLDELIGSVLKRMNLDEKAFRSFVAANDGLLKTVAARRRY
ncbi:MAG: hypothetical protein QM723_32495 [Myxococcaceae bacterium]